MMDSDKLTNVKATQWRDLSNRMQAKRSLRNMNAELLKPCIGRDDKILLRIPDNLATAWLRVCVVSASVSCALLAYG